MVRMDQQNKYHAPLSVFFAWHPGDSHLVEPIVDYCSSLLSRDMNAPFSRSMNLPVFYRTIEKKGTPPPVVVESQKALIFVFAGMSLATDDDWVAYVQGLPSSKAIHVVHVAMVDAALNMPGVLGQLNFIRAYEYPTEHRADYMFIAIAHEIYRFCLNDSFDEIAPGKVNSLKIFLSYTKRDEIGKALAEGLKNLVDTSQMNRFFDATDISPGYSFETEIRSHVQTSSIVAIHSDEYSSRYWCQREIMMAKEYDRPIIVVDALRDFEDRHFPFAANTPCVRVEYDAEPTKRDLLKVLRSILLETVRFYFSKMLLSEYKRIGWIDSEAEIRCRPPEVSDVGKVLMEDRGQIVRRHRSLIYPEPPVYSEEISFLSSLGVEISTPLSQNPRTLVGKVGISVSEPSDSDLIRIGQPRMHLAHLSQDLARHLLARSATLVYGGDLRKGGFTEFIFEEARVLQARLQSSDILVENYIAWPIYCNDSEELKRWKAQYRLVAKMVEVAPPPDVDSHILSKDHFLPPTNTENWYVWSRCLTHMREQMIHECAARVCAGGRATQYRGRMPGVLEEILLSLRMKKPLYLIGGFGGITANVCRSLETGTPEKELTLEWQIAHNSGYKDFLEYCSRQGVNCVDYELFFKELRAADFRNGLNEEDNKRLFITPFVDEALYLVLKGLTNILGSSGQKDAP